MVFFSFPGEEFHQAPSEIPFKVLENPYGKSSTKYLWQIQEICRKRLKGFPGMLWKVDKKCLGNFPEDVQEITWKLPGIYSPGQIWEMSGKSLGCFWEMSVKCSGNVREVSGRYLGIFQDNSRKCLRNIVKNEIIRPSHGFWMVLKGWERDLYGDVCEHLTGNLTDCYSNNRANLSQ